MDLTARLTRPKEEPRFYHPLTDEVNTSSEGWAIPLTEQRTFSETNTSFLEGTDIQFAWDSTSLNTFRKCHRKYFYAIIQGWTSREIAPPLSFGSAFHTCKEVWYKLLNENIEKLTALHRVARLALLLGESLPGGDTARTKESLVRTVVWYIDQFWDDNLHTLTDSNGKAIAEYSFAIPFTEIDGIQVYYCGHMDRPAEFHGEIWISDYKSTKYELDDRFFDMFKPDGQFSGYNIAGNVIFNRGVAGVIVDGIQLGVNYTRFRRKIIKYSPEEVQEDIQDIRASIADAIRCAKAGYWPKNPTACGMYFKVSKGNAASERAIIDNGCEFRSICSKPPGAREVYLKGGFTKRTWDPLIPR